MRLLLTIQDGSLTGHQISLETSFLSIGRGNDCAIQFPSDEYGGVSTHHAVVEASEDGFYLADQKSTNGTMVNGQPVERTRLSSGDMIQLGRTGPKIHVFIEATAQPAEPTLHLPSTTLRQKLSELSYYNPEKEKVPSYVGRAVGLVATGLMMMIVFLILLSSLGFVGALIGSVFAFLPAPFYLFIYLWMDRYDPEPPWALAGAFAWGGLFAIVVSFAVNTIFGSVAAMVLGETGGLTLAAVISAPVTEELTKGMGVLLIWFFLRKEFDGVLDGIVYAGVIGLGFATVENVLYYGRSFVEQGFAGLLVLGFLRGVLSPFIHSLFTSMTGIGCGIARESHNRTVQFVMPVAGLTAAMLLHGMWNLSASMMGPYFFVAYVFLWFPLFLTFLGVIFYMARREKKIIKRTLAFEVGFLITREELDLAASLIGRFTWLFGAIDSWRRFQARRRFLRAVTKLAFCYWHVERANAAQRHTISLPQIPRFRTEIAVLKEQI